ncbi:ABC transporter substrate-binding protein [Actinosynnema sp. CA-299493]
MRLTGLTVLCAALVTALAGCGGAPAADGTSGGDALEVVGTWSGDEQERFEKVLARFTEQTGHRVEYVPAGDELPTVLQTRLQGGNPPNVALIAQPGLVAQFVAEGELRPLGSRTTAEVEANYAKVWKDLGSVGGVPYGVYFKAANKSTIWYDAPSFTTAGVTPPKTWDEFLAVGRTLSDAGQAAVSIAGADGWTLTDWFENVYLRTAGPENYDKLAKHEIPWTDPTVKTALAELARLFGDAALVAGGSAGALQTEFPKSVTAVFGESPEASMVFEGDFVSGVVASSTSAKVGTDALFFPFPSIRGSADAVVAGGDMAVRFTDDTATDDLMTFLASAEGGAVWAAEGGFLSPNRNIANSGYPDEVTRELAGQLVDAGDNVRFDMSDLAPAAFGGTKGAGQWKVLQDFLADPASVDATAAKLEAEAAKAFTP